MTTSAGTTSLSYDYEDRITGITYPSTATNSFAYNCLDTRVGKTDSSGTATYQRDGVGVTDPLLTDGSSTFTPGVSQHNGSSSTFDCADRLGTYSVETNSSQTTTATRQYDAFGNPTSTTGSPAGPFGFAGGWGYQQDGDSGLKLLGHRYYDSSTGRFLSRDPAAAGRNWYIYCGNNPLAWVDPLGLNAYEVWLAVGTWVDDNLMGGAVSSAGDAAGRYEIGDASGWEVAGKGLVAAGAIVMTAIDLADGVGEAQVGGAAELDGAGALGGEPSNETIDKGLAEAQSQLGGEPPPPGPDGKWRSPQWGDSKRGIRFDPPHENRPPGHPELNWHFNWWDFTEGKPGRTGTVAIGGEGIILIE